MVSRSTAYCYATGDRINRTGKLAMVACTYCEKKNLECRMSSLNKVCGNCYRNGVKECVPVDIPLPDYLKLDQELARLEQQESEADAAESAALEALLSARAKKDRLRKQRKFLARREQKLMEELKKFVDEIEALEAAEDINREVGILESGLMPGTLALDWGTFSPTYLEGDPTFDEFLVESHGTALVAGGSS